MNIKKFQLNKSDSDKEFIKALRKGVIQNTCSLCGQTHPDDKPHLYDYENTLDDDLICHLCFQPFVNPVVMFLQVLKFLFFYE